MLTRPLSRFINVKSNILGFAVHMHLTICA
jgi:hypothetical protein